MSRLIRKTLFCILTLSCGLPAIALAQDVVDGINEGNTPIIDGVWSAGSYGIDFTPDTSYEVGRIEANWNGELADGRTITIEVYDANPNDGGQLLASSTFAQTATGWQGADISVSFQAGEDYFIGFANNADSMGRFFARDTETAELFTVWWGTGVGNYVTEDTPGDYHDPIWRFLGEASVEDHVPVPVNQPWALLLLGMLLAGFGWRSYRNHHA